MDNLVKKSKHISMLLRHKPEAGNLNLDTNGWVSVEALLRAVDITKEELHDIVRTNNKARFEIKDGKIRASQGHSVPVDLGYVPETPPAILYHGTGVQYVDSILTKGLKKMKRHAVHLSSDPETARSVGKRKGPVAVLRIRALDMHKKGHTFTKSTNGVWLVDSVPPDFIGG